MLAEPLRDLAVPLDDLTPLEGNPRRGDVAAVARSLKRFGQRKPIVARADGTVVAGNHTLAAARSLGWSEIAVVRVDDDEVTAKAYALADNRTSALGSFDEADLAAMVGEVQAVDPELLTAASFDEESVASLFGREVSTASASHPELDEVPALGKPVSASGDVWLLGEHRVLCGDATDPEDMARLFGDRRSANLVVTDPPYAIYGSSSGLSADVTDDKIVRPFFEALFRLVESRLEHFDHAYVFTDWRSWAAVWEGAKRAGMTGKNCLVWDKLGAGLGNNYANTHEFVGFFHKLPPSTVMTSGRRAGIRPVLKSNLLRFPRVAGVEREHNAAKPVALLAELIENSSQPGQVVFDPFGGSGSTLIAADQLGRVCLTSDIEPKWADCICRRWQRVTGQKPVLESAGEPHDFTT